MHAVGVMVGQVADQLVASRSQGQGGPAHRARLDAVARTSTAASGSLTQASCLIDLAAGPGDPLAGRFPRGEIGDLQQTVWPGDDGRRIGVVQVKLEKWYTDPPPIIPGPDCLLEVTDPPPIIPGPGSLLEVQPASVRAAVAVTSASVLPHAKVVRMPSVQALRLGTGRVVGPGDPQPLVPQYIEAYAKVSLKKYRPIAARNDDTKVFSGLL